MICLSFENSQKEGTIGLSFTNNLIHSREAVTRNNLVKIRDAPPALIQGTQLRTTGNPIALAILLFIISLFIVAFFS